MKIAIIYDSITGNTELLAKEIAKEVKPDELLVVKKVDEERKMEAYAFICCPKYRITVKAKVLFLNLCYITYCFS